MLVAMAVPIMAIAASGIGMLYLQGVDRGALRAIEGAVQVRGLAQKTLIVLLSGQGAAYRYSATGDSSARAVAVRDFASAVLLTAVLAKARPLGPSARLEAQQAHRAAVSLSRAATGLTTGSQGMALLSTMQSSALFVAVANLDAATAAQSERIGAANAENAAAQRSFAWILGSTLAGGIALTLWLDWLLLSDLNRWLRALVRKVRDLAATDPELDAVQPGRDQLEEVSQVIASLRTALARRMAGLREASMFLERLIVRSPLIFFAWELDSGRPIFISGNLQEVLGYHPEELVDVRSFWRQVTHPDDLPLQEERLQSLAQNGFGETEFRALRKDGRAVWLRTVGLLDEQEGVRNVLAYTLDIDNQRRMAEGLVAAREAAEAANREKSDFLSRMSHELRTPLNAILGFAQLLEMSELAPDDRESVEFIARGGRHLLALMNDLLDVSRIETGRLQLSPEPVQAAAAVEGAMPLVAQQAARRSVEITMQGTASDAVLADRQRLRQVLLNLLSNAVKYNRSGGRVHVSWQGQDAMVRFAVEDTGRGIAPERQVQLFLPFERLGAEETGEEGSGLGLVVVKRLVEAMGGEVGVVSQPGEGSTFWFTLPAAGVVVTVEEPAAGVKQDGPGGQPAVLHIEDNPQSVLLVRRLLGALPGLRVEAAPTAEAGLERALEGGWRLILLDLDLPGASGVELLRVLRQDARTRDVPVIVVSASGPDAAQRIAEVGGTTEYLAKPLQVMEFVAKCSSLLELEGR
ncbi:MAG: ATP-binding protein [Thermaerobacter sp.]|nr:ATP-binding protein [Thermaerobacter sp.]